MTPSSLMRDVMGLLAEHDPVGVGTDLPEDHVDEARAIIARAVEASSLEALEVVVHTELDRAYPGLCDRADCRELTVELWKRLRQR